jgi:hypothetical protein
LHFVPGQFFCENYAWRRGGLPDLFFWTTRDYHDGSRSRTSAANEPTRRLTFARHVVVKTRPARKEQQQRGPSPVATAATTAAATAAAANAAANTAANAAASGDADDDVICIIDSTPPLADLEVHDRVLPSPLTACHNGSFTALFVEVR